MGNKNWTKEEIELLKREYPHKVDWELVGMFNRTYKSITKKAWSLELEKTSKIKEQLREEKVRRFKENNPMKNPLIVKMFSEKMKINNPNKGKKPWNYGLTKEDLRVMKYSKKLVGRKSPWTTKRNLENNPMNNHKIKEKARKSLIDSYANGTIKKWQEGHTKETHPSIMKASKKLTGRKFSEEHKENIKKTHWSKTENKDKIFKNISNTKKEEYYHNEIGLKIGKSLREKYKSGEIVNKLRGKKMPKEIIEKQVKTKRERGWYEPEKNPNWRGGKSFEPYGLDFNNKLKRAIRKRDNQICILCGVHREKLKVALDVHHINYDKNCNIPENLISLCRVCHTRTNWNRKHWVGFLQNILSEKYNYKYKDCKPIINLEVKNEI